MKFEEIVRNVKDYLEAPPYPEILNSEESEILRKSFKIMTDDISGLIGGENVEQNNNKFSSIISSLLLLSSKVLEGPMPDEFVSFVVFYSEVSFNWNKYTHKDPVIRSLSLYISRLSETRTAMVKCINLMKELDQRLMVLQNWSPPAYEISKAYFEKLLEINEKE
jgi:hypothetical protein